MATQSPFPLLEEIFQKVPLSKLQPPEWVVTELQRRVVLLLNHVLMQESEAMNRLARYRGRILQVQWRSFLLKLEATPAGLLDLASGETKPDLVLVVTDPSALALAQSALRGAKPDIRIEGDVQLAAEVNWLAEHVRWDMEEDLARIMGDVPAHTLSQMVSTALASVRQFASKASIFVPSKVA